MLIRLTGVVADGSIPDATIPPLLPFRQDVSVPRGEDCTIEMTVVKSDRTPADLGDALSAKLGLRKFPDDDDPIFVKDGLLPGSNFSTNLPLPLGGDESSDDEPAPTIVTFTIVSADTIDLDSLVSYHFDVQLADSVGARWQLITTSKWLVGNIIARPGE